MCSSSLLITLILTAASLAHAHRPLARGTTCSGQFSKPEDALLVPDIAISWSMSRIKTCGPPEERGLWLTWENKDPEMDLYIGSGVPAVDRFQWIRMSYMVVGPGLNATVLEPNELQRGEVPMGIQKQIAALEQ